ncbi:MAG: signal peptidase I [Elusimicrobiaceae bacterium]
MEAKVILIGIIMAVYAYFVTKIVKAKSYGDRKNCALWHGIFWGAAAGIIFLMISVNFDNGQQEGLWYLVGKYKLIVWPAIILLAAVTGFFMLQNKDEKVVEQKIKSDLDWADTIWPVMIFGGIFMYFVLQGFRIPSGSMKDTLLIGDHLFVNKFVYGTRTPFTSKKIIPLRPVRRGDIIVFKFPSSSPEESFCGGPQYGRDFIKRVIGLPGETVEVKNGKVFINGAELKENYTVYADSERLPAPYNAPKGSSYQQVWESRQLGNIYGEAIRDNFSPIVVPEGQYFAMGDNRDRSCDSRFWGPVPENNVKGMAWQIFWPVTRAGKLSGKTDYNK